MSAAFAASIALIPSCTSTSRPSIVTLAIGSLGGKFHARNGVKLFTSAEDMRGREGGQEAGGRSQVAGLQLLLAQLSIVARRDCDLRPATCMSRRAKFARDETRLRHCR